MTGRIKTPLMALAALTAIICMFAALKVRLDWEKTQRTVEVCVDFKQVQTLAIEENRGLDEVLDELKQMGVTTLALEEDSFQSLEAQGLIDFYGAATLRSSDVKLVKKKGKKVEDESPYHGISQSESGQWNLISILSRNSIPSVGLNEEWTKDPNVFAVDEVLRRRYSTGAVEWVEGEDLSSGDFFVGHFGVITQMESGVIVTGNPDEIYTMGLGFGLSNLYDKLQKDFRIAPRLINKRDYTKEELLSALVDSLVIENRSAYIFSGEDTFGYPDVNNLNAAVNFFKENDLDFGWVEFAKQNYEWNYRAALKDQLVRVHSISDEEMEKYPTQKCIERYVRAARERGLKMMYLKPYLEPMASGSRLDFSLKYFDDTIKALKDAGFEIGPVGGIERTAPSSVIVTLLTLAGLILCFPLTQTLWGLLFNNPTHTAVLALLTLAGFFALPLIGGVTGLKLTALFMALLWPLLLLTSGMTRLLSVEPSSGVNSAARAIGAWAGMSVVTLFGALVTCSFLFSTDFALRIEEFSGVKIGLLLPVMLAAVLWVDLVLPDDWRGPLKKKILYLFQQPVLLGHAILAGAFLLAVLILLMRSGNESWVPVAKAEAGLRVWLEQELVVRPRTKEFLIGHPMMLLGLFMLFKGMRRPAWFLIVAGLIGQTSMFNTFMHLHTPLYISVVRSLWGLLFGLAGGLGLMAAFSVGRWLWERWRVD